MKAISKIWFSMVLLLSATQATAQANFGAGGTFCLTDVRLATNQVVSRFNTYEITGQQVKPMSNFGAMAGLNFAFRYRFPQIFGAEFGYSIANAEAKDLYQTSPTEKAYKNIITYRQSILHAGVEMRADKISIGAAYGLGTQNMTWKKTNDGKWNEEFFRENLETVTVHLAYDWQPHDRFSVAFRPFFQWQLNDAADFAKGEAKFVQQGTALAPNPARAYNYGIRVILFNGPTDND